MLNVVFSVQSPSVSQPVGRKPVLMTLWVHGLFKNFFLRDFKINPFIEIIYTIYFGRRQTSMGTNISIIYSLDIIESGLMFLFFFNKFGVATSR